MGIVLLLIPSVGRGQGSQPAQELLRQFENTRVFWQQFEVAKALVAAHDDTILPKLEPWLTVDDRLSRGNAAFVFAGLGDPKGFDTIVAILNDRSERTPGQGAIVFHTGPDLGTDTKLLVAAEIRQDRYYAAHLLGDLKDPRAVPILVRLLQDPDVKDIVPWSLGQIGDKSANPALIGALNDSNPNTRVLTIYALQQLGATEALPRLRELLDDTRRSTFRGQVAVSEAARAAIDKLESQPAPVRK